MRAFGAALIAVLVTAGTALAQTVPVQLFKVVTVKDEITIGVTAAEAAKLGAGPALEALATVLNRQGQLSAWQYAVRKGSDGSLEQAPLRRVVIFKTDSLRLEPVTLGATVKLVAPKE